MRIATWNVNSVKQRAPRLLPWLDQRQPDVVCLQETKLADDAFAELLGRELADRGYAVAAHGEATWNGVAILSRAGLDDVVAGIAGAPGFPHPEARAVSAVCDGIRVVSVYVPNGRVPGSEHYEYKLAWLAALRQTLAAGHDVLESGAREDRDAVPGRLAVRGDLVPAILELVAEQLVEGVVGELGLLQADDVGAAFVEPGQQPGQALLERVDVPGGDAHRDPR